MNANLAMLFAACGGVCIAVQATVNSKLRHTFGEPLWATYCSIIGTFTFASLAMLALRPTLPTMESVRNADWWQWIGGPLGTLFVLAGAMLVTYLGAARYIAFVVAGQLLASLLMDHFGLLGLMPQSISPGKVAGAMFIVIGVVCIKFL